MNRRGPVFAAVAAALVALLAFFFLVRPKMSAVAAKQDELTTAGNDESTLRARLASLKQLQDEAPVSRREIRKIEEEVPPTADPAGIIRLINAQAEGAAVDFISIAPGTPAPAPSGGFSIVQISVTAGGGFANLEDFLRRLETLDRATKVLSISLTGQQEAPAPPISIQLSVEMYTTDTSSGPGSVPGSSEAAAPAA